MRIIALDVGDRWTGIAISDPLGIFARPYKTIDSTQLIENLSSIITSEKITTIIIGHPQTLRGTDSAQTKKVVSTYETIKETFPHIECLLKDERFTSQEATRLKKSSNKEDKLQQHAIAAALVLTSYLEILQFEKS